MRTRNAMQLKALINNRAKAAGISPQLMLQDYLYERLLDRLSRSRWRNNVIVKGGVLIGSLLGVESRATKDLDTTVTGFTLTHETASKVFRGICKIDADDDFDFEFLRTEDIRETDDYPGIRVFLVAHYDPMAVPLSIDMTTGDAITPEAMEYEYPLAFDEGSIRIMAYPVETVLAEKLETVLSRGIANTRPRDYYDIYMLWTMRRDMVDLPTLADAVRATCEKRGSLHVFDAAHKAMDAVREDDVMLGRWRKFARSYTYARNMTLKEGCDAVVEIIARLDF